MSKMFFKIGLGVLAVAGLVWPSYAAVQGRTTLTGHVPAAVAHVATISQLPSNTNLNLAIGLPLRNQAALEILLQQINDPASTNYHNYLTPAQFTEQFGPTAQDYQAVVSFAQGAGLTVTATHPNRTIVDVSGTVAAIQTAFQIHLKTYQHPTESRAFYAPDTEPSVSSSLSILHISGLDNYSVPKPKAIPQTTNSNGTVSPKFGSAPGGSFLGSDFRKAYVPGTTLTGAGQNVGLLQFDGFFASDIAAYAALIGLTNPPNVIVVPVDGGVAVPGGGNAEVCLDIEMIFAMAPGVSNIYVYEAPNPSPWVDLLNRMANDNNARQLSCSWGGGPPNASAEQIFQQMAVQGQSFFNASGDDDAFVNQINPITFPSDSPNITQVGGVALTTALNGVFTSEQVWNNRIPNRTGYLGSSGGISTFYSIPTWQQGISMTLNHGSTTFRNVPDVALTAQDVWVTYDGGFSGSFVGTSCAAPLWAGYTALINQQAVINGKPSVGFLNPALYALAKGTNYTNVFNDVTVGDNTWPSSPTNFFAVQGYDLCTGLGTPKGTNLINALVGNSVPVSTGPVISAPRAPWGTTLGVMNGGNPNGSWFLFVQDDKPLDTGVISNGWAITLTSANPVGFASDNQMFASPTNANVNLGGNWTVTYSVTNYGPSIATNVLVTDDMPIGAGLSFAGAVPSVGSVSQLGSTLLWNIPTLAISAGAQLNVTFNATIPGTYTNSMVVSSGTTDPNPDDDTAVAYANVAVFTPPSFSSVTFSNGRPTIAVTNTSGPMSVVIQATTNLANPFSWLPIYTNTTPFSFTDLTATNYPYRFYRSLLGP